MEMKQPTTIIYQKSIDEMSMQVEQSVKNFVSSMERSPYFNVEKKALEKKTFFDGFEQDTRQTVLGMVF